MPRWALYLFLVYCLSPILIPTQPAHADGFRNPFQGSAAIGQGNAFVAQADDPSAVFYNPAGMTQLSGFQHSAGVQFVSVNTRYTSPTGVSTEDNNAAVGLPPPGQLFFTANLKDLGVTALGDLSVGLGLQSLYGFSSKYPENGPFNTAVTQAQLPLLDIKPTLAYKLSDQLSIGLGADIFTFASFMGEGHLEQQFRWPGGGGIPAGTPVELNGKGTTAGLNASFLYTPFRNDDRKPILNVGFVWRGQAVLPVKGQFLVNGTPVADASGSLRFPESYTMAIGGWPIRNQEREWKLEVDVDYVRWQSIHDNSVQLSNGATLANPQQLKNAVTVNVGTEHKWLHLPNHEAWELALRTGYIRSQSAFTDVSFTPAVADTGVNVASGGIGFLCHPGGQFLGLMSCGSTEKGFFTRSAMGIDLAYQYFAYDTRTITGNANPTVDGTYRTHFHVGSVTLRVNF